MKSERSELNYLIAGVILFFGGGYALDSSLNEEAIIGGVLLAIGIFLIGKGVLRGRR